MARPSETVAFLTVDREILDSGDGQPRQRLTKAVGFNEVDLPRSLPVLFGSGGSIVGAGVLHRGPAITTFERRLTIDQIHTFEPIESATVVSAITNRFRRYADDVFDSNISVFPPGTWRAIRQVLEDTYPDVVDLLGRLSVERSLPQWASSEEIRTTLALERDSIDMAMRMSGISGSSSTDWTATDAPAHFLEGLSSVPVREDQILQHDLNVFGGWNRLREYVGTYVVFERDGVRLTVINANRTPIEETLGVDLIYYHEGYDSFVIVQYKRMTREERRRDGTGHGEPRYVYRPSRDRNLAVEMKRMKRVVSMVPKRDAADSYRLRADPTYIKLCRPDLPVFTKSVSKGMYLPLDYWEWLLEAEATLGPKGGRVLSYETVPRHLTTTQFLALVGDGWIGTTGTLSATIGEYIREAADSGRALTLALNRPTPT